MPEGNSRAMVSPVIGRIFSPVILTFICMWIAWNYRVLFVLFSDMPVHMKFDFIERFLFTTAEVTVLYGLVYPFSCAITFLLIYPYLARGVYAVWYSNQKQINEWKRGAGKDMPATREEYQDLKKELEEIQNRYDDLLRNKDAEIARLRDLGATGARQLEIRPNVVMKSIVEVDENELHILRRIAANQGRMLENSVYEVSGLDQVKTDFYLLDLELKGYLKREFDNEQNVEYCTLTTRSNKIISHQIPHKTG